MAKNACSQQQAFRVQQMDAHASLGTCSATELKPKKAPLQISLPPALDAIEANTVE